MSITAPVFSVKLKTLKKKLGSYQQAALTKINFTNESDRIYLHSYTASQSNGLLGEAIGKFLLDGSLRNNIRERYQVTLHLSGEIKCTCPDAIHNTSKYNHFCKHVCFLICRVFEFFDPLIFRNRRLSSDQLNAALEIAANIHTSSVNNHIGTQIHSPNFQSTSLPPSDWVCAICYDDKLPIMEELVVCPDCRNILHRQCIAVWLEHSSLCVFCRSRKWETYLPPRNRRTK